MPKDYKMERAERKIKEAVSLLSGFAGEKAQMRIGIRTEEGVFDGNGVPVEETFSNAFFGEYDIYLFVPDENVRKIQRGIIAALDDVAQILGYRIPLCEPGYLPGKHCAYLIKDRGILALGRSPKEAETGVRVAQKAVALEIYGRALGGTKRINRTMASLEHLVYQKKYSRKEVQADR